MWNKPIFKSQESCSVVSFENDLSSNFNFRMKKGSQPSWMEVISSREELNEVVNCIWERFMLANDYLERFQKLNIQSQPPVTDRQTRLSFDSRLKIVFDIYGITIEDSGLLRSSAMDGSILLEDPRIWVMHIKNNLRKEDFNCFTVPLVRQALNTAGQPEFVTNFFLKVIPNEMKLHEIQLLEGMTSNKPRNFLLRKRELNQTSSSYESKKNSQTDSSQYNSECFSSRPAIGERELIFQPTAQSDFNFEKEITSFDFPDQITVEKNSTIGDFFDEEEFKVIDKNFNDNGNFAVLMLLKNETYIISPRRIFKTLAARRNAAKDFTNIVENNYDFSEFSYCQFNPMLLEIIDSSAERKTFDFSVE